MHDFEKIIQIIYTIHGKIFRYKTALKSIITFQTQSMVLCFIEQETLLHHNNEPFISYSSFDGVINVKML